MAAKHTIQHEVEDNIEIARAEAPRFEKVNWKKEPHLRNLYFMSIFLMVASATTGYDGMLVNTSQQMNTWQSYFPEVQDANKLGILINMFNIGSIVSFFITPYVADTFGRKVAIGSGCAIMIVGGCLSAFCNGYGSEYPLAFFESPLIWAATDQVHSVHWRSLHPRFRQLAGSDVVAPAAD